LAARGQKNEEPANGNKKELKGEVKKVVQTSGQVRATATVKSTTTIKSVNTVQKPKGISNIARQAGAAKPSTSRLNAAPDDYNEFLRGQTQEKHKQPTAPGDKEHKRLETKSVGDGGKRGMVDLKEAVASFVCTAQRGSEDLMVPDSEADEDGRFGPEEGDEGKKEEMCPIEEEQNDVGADDFATHLSQFNWGV
jgi:hypothetical protein